MHEQTPRIAMHDDPRLPPLELAPSRGVHPADPPRPSRPVVPLERQRRLAGALDEIKGMEGDLVELRARCGLQEAEIARQQSYIAFLENQCKTMDQERLLYMRKAVSLARQIKSIWGLCEEGNLIAKAAEHLPEETP